MLLFLWLFMVPTSRRTVNRNRQGNHARGPLARASADCYTGDPYGRVSYPAQTAPGLEAGLTMGSSLRISLNQSGDGIENESKRRHDRARHHGLGDGIEPAASGISRRRLRRAAGSATSVRAWGRSRGAFDRRGCTRCADSRHFTAFGGCARSCGKRTRPRAAPPRSSSTALPLAAKEAARRMLARKAITLLDCPGAVRRRTHQRLNVYASGPRAACNACKRSLRRLLARIITSARSARNQMKFIANLLVAIHNVAAGRWCWQKGGARPSSPSRWSAGAGSSRYLQVRGPMMVADDYREATMKVRCRTCTHCGVRDAP